MGGREKEEFILANAMKILIKTLYLFHCQEIAVDIHPNSSYFILILKINYFFVNGQLSALKM